MRLMRRVFLPLRSGEFRGFWLRFGEGSYARERAEEYARGSAERYGEELLEKYVGEIASDSFIYHRIKGKPHAVCVIGKRKGYLVFHYSDLVVSSVHLRKFLKRIIEEDAWFREGVRRWLVENGFSEDFLGAAIEFLVGAVVSRMPSFSYGILSRVEGMGIGFVFFKSGEGGKFFVSDALSSHVREGEIRAERLASLVFDDFRKGFLEEKYRDVEISFEAEEDMVLHLKGLIEEVIYEEIERFASFRKRFLRLLEMVSDHYRRSFKEAYEVYSEEVEVG